MNFSSNTLVVDILNFLDQFSDPNDYWNINKYTVSARRLRKFCDANQLKMVFVADGPMISDAMLEKHMRRKLQGIETSDGTKCAPIAKILAHEALEKENFEFYYAIGNDKIPTLVALACELKADIVSKDHRVYTYSGTEYKVYYRIFINKDNTVLMPNKKSKSELSLNPEFKEVPIPELPKIAPTTDWAEVNLINGKKFIAGVGSSLIKELGNINKWLIPARAALYDYLKIDDVTEEIPSYDADSKKAYFETNLVSRDSSEKIKNPFTCLIKCAEESLNEKTTLNSSDFDKHLFAMFVYGLDISRAYMTFSMIEELSRIKNKLYAKGGLVTKDKLIATLKDCSERFELDSFIKNVDDLTLF